MVTKMITLLSLVVICALISIHNNAYCAEDTTETVASGSIFYGPPTSAPYLYKDIKNSIRGGRKLLLFFQDLAIDKKINAELKANESLFKEALKGNPGKGYLIDAIVYSHPNEHKVFNKLAFIGVGDNPVSIYEQSIESGSIREQEPKLLAHRNSSKMIWCTYSKGELHYMTLMYRDALIANALSLHKYKIAEKKESERKAAEQKEAEKKNEAARIEAERKNAIKDHSRIDRSPIERGPERSHPESRERTGGSHPGPTTRGNVLP